MKKWKDLKRWYKGGILGFFIIFFFNLSLYLTYDTLGWLIIIIPASSLFALAFIYNTFEKMPVFWRKLRYWQKGGILFSSFFGVTHIIFVTWDLIFDEGQAFTHLAAFYLEAPLIAFHLGVLKPLFGKEFFPKYGVAFWVWIYVGGSIAWGVVGAVPGFILGYLTGLSKT